MAFISLEAGTAPDAEPIVRTQSRKVKSDIGLYQRRAGVRGAPLWIEVLHGKARDGSPKFGSHLLAPMPSAPQRDKLVESVNTSTVYGRNAYARDVPDYAGLTNYLLQEMTPQAAWRTGIRRSKGSHPLGELGGDRVRAAPALRDMLVRTGRVNPHQRTYAARRPKIAARNAGEPTTWLFNADGQGLLFEVIETPPTTRSPSPPILRPKLAPVRTPMLRLFSSLPNVDVIDAMKTLGPTHQSIAERLNISRAQVTNILNGQFGPSRVVVQRVLDFTKAA